MNNKIDRQMNAHIFIRNTVHDSRVLSRLMVANGLRRIVDAFSFVCVRGDSSINWFNRFAVCGEDGGVDDRREFFIDDANLFKHSLHWSCERSCCNWRI